MISTDDEEITPKISSPMTDSFDESDQLFFISWEFAMLLCHGLTEKCDGLVILLKDSSYSGFGCVTLNYEGLREVG